VAGDDWSREEVEAAVADYFSMLRDELAGITVNKAEHNRRLRKLLRDRSEGSVEFKHANISAVLNLHGNPYIEGYKPRPNFQGLLENVVLEYLDLYPEFFEPVLDGPVLNPRTAPELTALDVNRVVEAPPEEMKIPHAVWSPTARLTRFDFVARDAANRDLGRRGEEFVLEFERKRVHDSGRRDLAGRIEWTSHVRGDGTGYDIQSFNADGTPRLIEVKTTGLGKYFPFNVTVNEVRCSEARAHEFHLYRVFHFGPDARLYVLAGELSKSCHLDPTQYRAFVQHSSKPGSTATRMTTPGEPGA
jgi:hypothetical protein